MADNDFKTQEVRGPEMNLGPAQTPNFSASVLEAGFYKTNKFYIWASVLAIAVIGVLGYLAFRPRVGTLTGEANIQVDIQAPETLPSGQEAVYRITIKNNDANKLVDLQLELTYPEGFTYVGSTPLAQNLSGTAFSIKELLSGQNPSIIVKAKTSGDINSEKKLFVRLSYKYNNYSSSFVKEASHSIRLTASNVVLEMDGPKETNIAQLVAYTVSYKNNSSDTIKNARIRLIYSEGFKFGSAQPQASLADNIWNIGDLQSMGEGKISLQGTFGTSQPGESKTLKAEFLVLGESGEYFTQSTAEIHTEIISQPLLLTLENLDQRESGVVSPGETLNFAVRYQNNAQIAATGINISVEIDSKALDLSSIRAQGGQISNNTISWNAAGVPNLQSLNPSEQGTLNFYVTVKNPATKDSSKNLTVNFSSKIKANEYSTFLPGGSVSLKVSSPAQFQNELTYISGSLPPKVGTQTKYKATIKLYNSSNDFNSAVFSCFLPTVSGTFDKQSINAAEREKVSFDPATGKLTWDLGILPAYSGKFSPAKVLEFEVALSPAPADAGSAPALLRNIQLFAKDSFTAEDIDIKAENITSASLSGQSGYSNGIVVP